MRVFVFASCRAYPLMLSKSQ